MNLYGQAKFFKGKLIDIRLAEDPAPFDLADKIYVVNLRDLQQKNKNPSVAPRLQSQRWN